MSVIKKEDHILEAIDQLRRRKARPDANRICNFLLRRFNIDRSESLLLLNSVVVCVPPKVIKVTYKGFTSYRRSNATKLNVQPDYSAVLVSALSELIVDEPDYLDFGVPPDEFEKFLIAKDKNKFTKRNVNAIIQGEIDKGNLVSLETGNLSIVDGNSSTLDSMDNSPFKSCVNGEVEDVRDGTIATSQKGNVKLETEEIQKQVRGIILGEVKTEGLTKRSPVTTKKPTERKRKLEAKSKTSTDVLPSAESVAKAMKLESEGFRDGARRKRAAKKVFDPSESSLKPQLCHKRGRKPSVKNDAESPQASVGDEPMLATVFGKQSKGGVCCVCHSLGSAEKLVSCRDCTNRAHPSCTERRYESGVSAWQCLHCKTCCVCSETDEYAPMIVCSLCDDGYHFSCHMPQVAYKPKVAWVCTKCLDAAARMKPAAAAQISQACATARLEVKASPSPAASPPASPAAEVQASSSSGVSSGSGSDRLDAIDHRVPDASGWSVEQVADYLTEQGYQEQADAFRQNEIDGTSLLLMKRSDVLMGLQLKLGPALKAYKQVKRLQIRRSELHLLWA